MSFVPLTEPARYEAFMRGLVQALPPQVRGVQVEEQPELMLLRVQATWGRWSAQVPVSIELLTDASVTAQEVGRTVGRGLATALSKHVTADRLG